MRAAGQGRAGIGAARAAWRAELAGVEPRRLVLLDESGTDTRTTRAYGRAAGGPRAAGEVPRGRWERLTVLGAPALGGIIAGMSVAAATGTAVFAASVERALAPALRSRPDAIVVMDNLSAHEAGRARAAFEAAGIAYRYLPAYPPDLNPIEPAWAKLEGRPRARAARSRDAPDAELGPALATISAADARGWFRLAGCPAPD